MTPKRDTELGGFSKNWTWRPSKPVDPQTSLLMNWCAGVLLVFWMQKEHTWSRVKWLRKAWNDGHFLLGLRNQVCTCIRDGYTGKSKGMRQRVGGKGWLPISVWSTVARPARTWGLCREQEVLALHPEHPPGQSSVCQQRKNRSQYGGRMWQGCSVPSRAAWHLGSS